MLCKGLIKNGLLYYKADLKHEVLEVPNSLISTAIYLCHNTPLSGHFGPERTLKLLQERYHFPKMNSLAKDYVSSCVSCLATKGNKPPPANLHSYPAPSLPWQRTSMDILGPFPKSSAGNKYVIVFCDYLTRYCEIAALPDMTSEVVAKALLDKVITNHSCPSVLISDNALSFVSCFPFSLQSVQDSKGTDHTSTSC